MKLGPLHIMTESTYATDIADVVARAQVQIEEAQTEAQVQIEAAQTEARELADLIVEDTKQHDKRRALDLRTIAVLLDQNQQMRTELWELGHDVALVPVDVQLPIQDGTAE